MFLVFCFFSLSMFNDGQNFSIWKNKHEKSFGDEDEFEWIVDVRNFISLSSRSVHWEKFRNFELIQVFFCRFCVVSSILSLHQSRKYSTLGTLTCLVILNLSWVRINDFFHDSSTCFGVENSFQVAGRTSFRCSNKSEELTWPHFFHPLHRVAGYFGYLIFIYFGSSFRWVFAAACSPAWLLFPFTLHLNVRHEIQLMNDH